MKAVIYKSTGSWYLVRSEEGKFYNARIKGIFKIEGITSTNPLAVGDEVTISFEGDAADNAIITEISERRNYIARSSPHHRMQHHIIAANIDQSLLFATLKEPKTSQGFIDRFLITSEAFHIPPVIVFNKSDLYRKKEMEKYRELSDIYSKIGYKVLLISLENKEGVSELEDILRAKITLLSGHSGTGKSTFINGIFPDLALRTNEVSGWSGKGMHTTTFTEMYDLPFGGRIIDTPGIREFGITGIPRQEISHYFPEMRLMLAKCQFNNCLHINEPGCAVKNAVEEGKISFERYQSYCNILDSVSDRNY
jgi:ribosome biogenesis GTPase